MIVECENSSDCSYRGCDHHGLHESEEECIDTMCQEYDTCIEPGDFVRRICVPAEELDPCPECGAALTGGDNMSGVKCTKCDYWFCF